MLNNIFTSRVSLLCLAFMFSGCSYLAEVSRSDSSRTEGDRYHEETPEQELDAWIGRQYIDALKESRDSNAPTGIGIGQMPDSLAAYKVACLKARAALVGEMEYYMFTTTRKTGMSVGDSSDSKLEQIAFKAIHDSTGDVSFQRLGMRNLEGIYTVVVRATLSRDHKKAFNESGIPPAATGNIHKDQDYHPNRSKVNGH